MSKLITLSYRNMKVKGVAVHGHNGFAPKKFISINVASMSMHQYPFPVTRYVPESIPRTSNYGGFRYGGADESSDETIRIMKYEQLAFLPDDIREHMLVNLVFRDVKKIMDDPNLSRKEIYDKVKYKVNEQLPTVVHTILEGRIKKKIEEMKKNYSEFFPDSMEKLIKRFNNLQKRQRGEAKGLKNRVEEWLEFEKYIHRRDQSLREDQERLERDMGIHLRGRKRLDEVLQTLETKVMSMPAQYQKHPIYLNFENKVLEYVGIPDIESAAHKVEQFDTQVKDKIKPYFDDFDNVVNEIKSNLKRLESAEGEEAQADFDYIKSRFELLQMADIYDDEHLEKLKKFNEEMFDYDTMMQTYQAPDFK